MKKTIYFLLFSIFLFTSCEKDSIENEQILEFNSRAGFKVDVCHKGDNEIIISINAVDTHRAHGDAIDMDGDGYFDKENICSVGVDCDDNNPNIYSGAPEICGDGIDNNCDEEVDESCETLQIGDFYEGGVVYYIFSPDDGMGYVEGETHGLISFVRDLGDIQWRPSGQTEEIQVWAYGPGIENTQLIVNAYGPGNYAAYVCYDLGENGYNDWYLPDEDELRLLREQKEIINLATIDYYGSLNYGDDYWSSTEDEDYEGAYAVFMGDNNELPYPTHKSNFNRVRPIRKF